MNYLVKLRAEKFKYPLGLRQTVSALIDFLSTSE